MNTLKTAPGRRLGLLTPAFRWLASMVAVLSLMVPLRAEVVALDIEDAEGIFDPGLFGEGEIEIINGKVVVKAATEKPEEKPEPDPAGTQVLELTDGSQLHGQLVTLAKGEVVWQRADATEPLIFTPQEVRRLVLSQEPAKAGATDATIKLSGSDWLAGQLSEMRDGKFVVRIGTAEPIEIAREKVEWLALSPLAPPDTYDGPIGPMGLAGWEMAVEAGAAWDYADGALVAKNASAIMRQFEVMPDKVDIQFTAGDGGSSNRGLTLWIQPGNRTRGYGKGSCYLRFQSNTVTANYHTGEQMKNFTGNIPEEKDDKKLTRYRLLFDRKAGRLIVQINGHQVADWDLPETPAVAPSGNLSWQPSYWSSNMAWTLSNVRVRPWDGSLAAETEEEVRQDSLTVAGQPRKAGALEGLTAETITFGGETVPRKTDLFLRMAAQDSVEPPASAIARVWLAQRGEFDVTGIGFRDGMLRVRTSFGGDLALPATAIRAIEFPHRLGAIDETAVAAGDILVFKNGDQLRGTLQAASHDKPLRWKPVKGDKVVEFSTGRLAGVLLASRRPTANVVKIPEDGPVSAAVRFHNGDWMPGEIQAMDEEQVRLRTEWGGDLRIARTAVKTLYLSSAGEAPVWDGASEREVWLKGTTVPGAWGEINSRSGRREEKKASPWRYLDGAFTLMSSSTTRGYNNGPHIGRALQALPDKVDVSFVISTVKGPASYSVQLFFDENKPGFMVQGGWDSAYLYDMSPRRGGAAFFNQPQQLEFGEKIGTEGNERHFRFLAERKSGRIWMFVNGQFVGSLSKRAGADNPKGKGISIVPQPMLSRVTISNLWIAPWSGILPESATRIKPTVATDMPEEAEAEENAEVKVAKVAPTETAQPEVAAAPIAEAPTVVDTVALSNGDETTGKVLAATAEMLTLRCDVGDLEIPLKRTSLVDFASQPVTASKGIRLRFAGKGAITVDSLRVEAGNVICQSVATGVLTFPLEQLAEIIYEPNIIPSAPLSMGAAQAEPHAPEGRAINKVR